MHYKHWFWCSVHEITCTVSCCAVSLNGLYSRVLISIAVSSIYFIAQVKQILCLYCDVVCIIGRSQKDLWDVFTFSSVLFWSILVGLLMMYLIMSVNVKGSRRMFMSLMSLSPLRYDLFRVVFQIGDFFKHNIYILCGF